MLRGRQVTRHEYGYIGDYYDNEGEALRRSEIGLVTKQRGGARPRPQPLNPVKENQMQQEDTNMQHDGTAEDDTDLENVGKRQVNMTTGDRLEWARKLDRLFATRRPIEGKTNQARYIRAVRELGREFAEQLIRNTPHCADQIAALRCVRESVLWAEEAIIHEGLV